MPLLPPGALDRGPLPLEKSSGFTAFLRKQEEVSSPNARELIKEGAHCGDFLHFHSSGDTFHSVYSVGEKLGEGGFGKVFACTHKRLGTQRAVKRLCKERGRRELHKNELNALLALDHPHIVKLTEYYDEEDYLYLVFEKCEGQDLFEAISSKSNGRMVEYDAAVAFRHVLKALQCCHSQHRGHYDIKPDNFMFTHKSGGNLKMVDLGLSSAFDTQRRSKVSGTSHYMAPEFWDGIYGPEGDVWSCGVVLFVMLTGQSFLEEVPSSTMKRELRVRKLLTQRLERASEEFQLSASAQDLLCQMLRHDRHARITIKEALKHPFNTGSYDLERRVSSKVQTDDVLAEAYSILRDLPQTIRAIIPEPMLKRVTRLILTKNTEVGEACCLAFRMLDLHGYGELSISALEQCQLITESFGGTPPPDFEDIFEAMDLNRDGYISYRAFLSVTLPDHELRNRDALGVAFEILERDKDGFIGQSDLAEIFGHSHDSIVCKATIEEVKSDGIISLDDYFNLMDTPLVT